MLKPLFTIITVNKNNLEGLLKTYHSLIDQEFSDFEWIVIDGFSTDGSQDFILNEVSELSNSKFLIEADKGLYDAMNKGMKMAAGKYILYLNSGDQFCSKKTLSDVANISAVTDYDMIYGDTLEFDSTSGATSFCAAANHNLIAWKMFAHHQSIFFKNIFSKNIPYSNTLRIGADYEYICKFTNIYKNFTYVDLPISIFELGGVSNSHWLKNALENFGTRRTVLRKSITFCILILFYNITANVARVYAKPVYSFVRPLIRKTR